MNETKAKEILALMLGKKVSNVQLGCLLGHMTASKPFGYVRPDSDPGEQPNVRILFKDQILFGQVMTKDHPAHDPSKQQQNAHVAFGSRIILLKPTDGQEEVIWACLDDMMRVFSCESNYDARIHNADRPMRVKKFTYETFANRESRLLQEYGIVSPVHLTKGMLCRIPNLLTDQLIGQYWIHYVFEAFKNEKWVIVPDPRGYAHIEPGQPKVIDLITKKRKQGQGTRAS